MNPRAALRCIDRRTGGLPSRAYAAGLPALSKEDVAPYSAPTPETPSPTISVIIPVYNGASTIERCVNSVLAQTHENLDVIMVDDGSTDGSGAICDTLAGRDRRVCVAHTPNRGLSAARNAGIDLALAAGAPYIAFADADDHLEPEMLEKLLEALGETRADIAQCGYYLDGLRTHSKRAPVRAVYSTTEALAALLDGSISNAVWNKLYRSRIFATLRFPEGRVFEDVSTTYRMLLLADSVASIPFAGYHYAMRKDSISHMTTMRNLADYWQARKERYDFFAEVAPGILGEKQMSALASDVVAAGLRTWRWAFGRPRRERAQYIGLFDEITEFVRTTAKTADTGGWPIHLKASLVLMRRASPAVLGASYLANQLYIQTHTGNSWTRQ